MQQDSTRRSNRDRTEATRADLIAAARKLFTEKSYAETGTPEIVAAAGVTRGALYHQFADKRELFAAVFEQVEAEVTQRTARAAVASGATDPLAVLRVGALGWLEACSEPEVQRIVLLDGPAVLGWAAWREIGMRYALGLVENELQEAVDAGSLAPQPVSALAHVLMGALDEAALYVATADDQDAARAEVGAVIDRLLGSLA